MQTVDPDSFDPFSRSLGLILTKYEDGFSSCYLEVTENLLNRHGTLHGGIIYVVADTAMGAALYTCLYEDELCATINCQIIYIKPAKRRTIMCDSRVIKRGKKLGMVESEIRQDDVIVAKAFGTYSIFKGDQFKDKD